MLGLKLNHVSKSGPWCRRLWSLLNKAMVCYLTIQIPYLIEWLINWCTLLLLACSIRLWFICQTATQLIWCVFDYLISDDMMTSSNGNIFRVTGPLCGEFTGHRWNPPQRPVTRSFDVFLDLRLNKKVSKQSWGWWFETPSRSVWRHCNDTSKRHSTWCDSRNGCRRWPTMSHIRATL